MFEMFKNTRQKQKSKLLFYKVCFFANTPHEKQKSKLLMFFTLVQAPPQKKKKKKTNKKKNALRASQDSTFVTLLKN